MCSRSFTKCNLIIFFFLRRSRKIRCFSWKQNQSLLLNTPRLRHCPVFTCWKDTSELSLSCARISSDCWSSNGHHPNSLQVLHQWLAQPHGLLTLLLHDIYHSWLSEESLLLSLQLSNHYFLTCSTQFSRYLLGYITITTYFPPEPIVCRQN